MRPFMRGHGPTNAIYAAITIPVSIGPRPRHGPLFVHRHIAGRPLLRMAYFTPPDGASRLIAG